MAVDTVCTPTSVLVSFSISKTKVTRRPPDPALEKSLKKMEKNGSELVAPTAYDLSQVIWPLTFSSFPKQHTF